VAFSLGLSLKKDLGRAVNGGSLGYLPA